MVIPKQLVKALKLEGKEFEFEIKDMDTLILKIKKPIRIKS